MTEETNDKRIEVKVDDSTVILTLEQPKDGYVSLVASARTKQGSIFKYTEALISPNGRIVLCSFGKLKHF